MPLPPISLGVFQDISQPDFIWIYYGWLVESVEDGEVLGLKHLAQVSVLPQVKLAAVRVRDGAAALFHGD